MAEAAATETLSASLPVGTIEERLVVVVMAGGSGTRFWPASRRDRPKQLLSLLSDETLLAATVERIAPICPAERTLIVTAARLVDASRAALPSLQPGNVLGEPIARNTAPCLALAAIASLQLCPDAIVALLPADQHVGDAEAFRAALLCAANATRDGGIATLGVEPTHPETGYGYIEVGERGDDGCFDVVRFVEKPDLERAVGFLLGKRHLWNAGVFVGRADALLAAADHALPVLAEAMDPLRETRSGSFASPTFQAALAATFARAPSISIDHGIMEQRDDLRVVPLRAGWSDVGSWRSLLDLRATADAGDTNYVRGDVIAIDCEGCVLVSDHHVLAAVGMRDVAVVSTADAMLVLPLDRSQDVRAVVAALEAAGRDHVL